MSQSTLENTGSWPQTEEDSPIELTDFDRRLINRVQSNFPVCDDPYSLIAAELGVSKHKILKRLNELNDKGVFSRFGAVLNHQRLGRSLLAAMRVPNEKLTEVVKIVNQFDEVNHNYLREHLFNLWFVVAGKSDDKVEQTILSIERETGLPVMRLPMEKAYHLNLAFSL